MSNTPLVTNFYVNFLEHLHTCMYLVVNVSRTEFVSKQVDCLILCTYKVPHSELIKYTYINCSHFAFTWKKYQFNMHARIKYHANTEKYYSFYITIAKKVRKSLDKQWCDKKHQKVRRLQFPKPLSIMRFPETSLPGND